MPSNTTNLALYKKDPATDGADTFNITTMLNDNWDKIDALPGTATPVIDGAAAVGVSKKYAREDHVHPTDTTRLAATSYTAADVLAKLKTVDGAGSGLDAATVLGYVPWGDNTVKTYVHATLNAAQSIAHSTATKINWNVEATDTLAEFDTTTSRFTAKTAGVYTIDTALLYADFNDTSTGEVHIYINGVLKFAGSRSASGGGAHHLQYIVNVNLVVSDYVDIYTFQNTGVVRNTNTSAQYSRLIISRE
jgi:hypothetical protein